MRHFALPICAAFIVLAGSTCCFGQDAAASDDWPQWRGPNRDGNSLATGLSKEWPDDGPAVAWEVDTVGVGYASLAVKDGRIYTQGDIEGIETVICLDARDGQTLWAVQPEPVAAALDKRVAKEFDQIDTDKSGKIDEFEALTRFGWERNKYNQPLEDAPQVSQKRAEILFKGLDQNRDGKLSFAEAGRPLRDSFDRADLEDKSVDAIALASKRTAEYLGLDRDRDSRISKEEAQGTAVERHFGRMDQPDPATSKGDELLTPAEIQEALLKHEPGRDGLVTMDEFRGLYENAQGDGELTREELRSAIGGYRSGMGDGPRGTPAVDEDRVYVEGALGDVSCLNASSGETLWHVNLVRDFAGNMPGAGYCESPLVAGNLLIVSPGGKEGAVLALDKMTGEMVWQSSEVTETVDYASPIAAEINGVPQVVQFCRESVFGVSLADGKLLWRYEAPASSNANCCTPIVEGNFVFASSGYGTGGGLAEIVADGDGQRAEEVYFQKRMACHYGGMVKVGDCVYSNADGPLVCMDFKTGKINWQARSVGKGALVAADGMLYLVSEGHELALVEASPEECQERGRFKSKTTKSAVLSHPVLANGMLLVREQAKLVAYDVRGNGTPPERIAERPKSSTSK